MPHVLSTVPMATNARGTPSKAPWQQHLSDVRLVAAGREATRGAPGKAPWRPTLEQVTLVAALRRTSGARPARHPDDLRAARGAPGKAPWLLARLCACGSGCSMTTPQCRKSDAPYTLHTSTPHLMTRSLR